ncbi:MAG: glycosyltransferase family 9 protein [Armatimonadota bacterium]
MKYYKQGIACTIIRHQLCFRSFQVTFRINSGIKRLGFSCSITSFNHPQRNSVLVHSQSSTLNHDKSFNWDEVHRLLLVRLRTIGNTVLSTTVLSTLKSWRPDLHIDVLIEPLSAPIFHGNPHIDRLIVIPREHSLKKTTDRLRRCWELRTPPYDLLINLHGGPSAMSLAWLIGARWNVVFASRRWSFLANHRVPSPETIWGKTEAHTVERDLAILKWLGVPMPCPLPAAELHVDASALAQVYTRLAQVDIAPYRYAVLHVAASHPSKCWAPARFALIADYLREQYAITPVILVAPHERKIADEVARNTRHMPVIISDLSLPEVFALISQAALLLGNDSSPAHMAAALKTPVAVIFGPTKAAHWYPWSTDASQVILPPAQHRHERHCLRFIEVDAVIAAIDDLIRAHVQLEVST